MPQQIRVNDPVEFRTADQLVSGFVTSINGRRADVTLSNGLEYRVSLPLLRRRQGVAPKLIFTSRIKNRCAFSLNDEVYFEDKSKRISGTICQLNPARARVKTDDGYWDIPYGMLQGKDNAERGRRNLAKLTATVEQADRLLQKHGLKDWRFTFDNASKRAGSCVYESQLITLSLPFCLEADQADISDTILHEIAHALVGPEHGHDLTWQLKARQIGCSAERTHCVDFSAPKFIISCKKCGTYGVRNKRGRNRVCRDCRTPITYEFYSEELWNSYRK